ncbi:hypothetical protein PEDI_32860 [Persicobacter diffluens]|uniref:Uncharacterized protein n=1 Tax=Persicobacter diffluens TaxID=981 RepID=A0AAN4W0N3_9BACT|nr:hypothetical protein PEDI_32860 [Persicobacter diffluens]
MSLSVISSQTAFVDTLLGEHINPFSDKMLLPQNLKLTSIMMQICAQIDYNKNKKIYTLALFK